MFLRASINNTTLVGKFLLVAVVSLLLFVTAAQAQATGGWTLNIDNTGYNPMQAGGVLPYAIRVSNNENVGIPATTVKFDIPSSAQFLGVTGFSNCISAPPTGQPLTVTCDVPALDPSGYVDGVVKLAPREAGTVTLTATIPAPGPSVSRQTTILKGADLSVALNVPATIRAGSVASFSATVTNNGPYASDGAQLSIPIPTGMSPNVTLPSGCTISSGSIICTIPGPIASGASVVLNFSDQVTTASASSITFAAAVKATTPGDPVDTNNSATASMRVTKGTDVSIGKVRTPQGLVLVGDPVTFTLNPSFAGTAPTTGSIADPLPANYQILSVTPTAGSGWSCPAPSGQTVNCSYTAAPGSDFTAPIKITTKAITVTAAGTPVTNTATVRSPNENAGAGGNNTGSDSPATIVVPVIDLVAQKSGPPRGLVTVGNSYQFQLSSVNNGNAPFSGRLTITDHLPAGLKLTAASLPSGWTCSPALPADGPVEFSCVTDNYTASSPLAAGQQTPTLVLTTEVTAPGAISNSMTVSFPNYLTLDGNPPDNTISTTVTSAGDTQWADVAVKKSITSSVPSNGVNAGDLITFAIEISNAGPTTALDVLLDDKLNDIVKAAGGGAVDGSSAVVSVAPGNASGMSCSAPASGAYSADLQCSIAQLPVCTPGANCPVVTVTVHTGSQGAKTNTATAFSIKTPDNDTTNNTSSVDYKVANYTDVTVTKQSPATAAGGAPAGQDLIYVLTASVPDNGLSSADNVTITDTLPDGLMFQGATTSEGSCSVSPTLNSITASGNNTLICNLGTIGNGSQQTVQVQVTPTTALVGSIVTNDADVSTSSLETDANNNHAELPLKILPPMLDLIISKADAVDPIAIGDRAQYTITVHNTGPSDAFNLVVTDTLPATGMVDPQVTAPLGATCVLNGTSPSVPGGTVVCTFPYFAANATSQIALTTKSTLRGRFVNAVSLTSDETAGGYGEPTDNNSDTEDTTVRERVDLLVTKVPSVSAIDLRQEFTWTITVTNQVGAGLGLAEFVTLHDPLPAGMVLTKVPTSSVGSCTGAVGGQTIDCQLGDMVQGAVATVTLTTKITSPSAQSAANSATASTLSFEQTPPNNTGTGTIATVRSSSISGTLYRDFNADNLKTAGKDTGIAGITMTVTGTALHDGAAITATTTTKSDGTYSLTGLPPGTYDVSYGTIAEQHLIDGKALPAANDTGAPAQSAKGVDTISGVVITNSFAATSEDFTRVPVPRIGAGKTVGTPQVQADGSYTVTYTLGVTNLSLEPVAGILLTDVLNDPSQNFGTYHAEPLAEGQYNVTVSGGTFGTLNSSFSGVAGTLSDVTLVSNGTLAAGASGSVTMLVHVNPVVPRAVPALIHTNQTSVSGTASYSGKAVDDISNNTSNPDPDGNGIANEAGNNDPTTVTPDPAPAIKLTKTATPAWTVGPKAGDRINYSFKVENTGKTALFKVLVTDPLPNLQGLSATPIARLNPGASDSTSFSAYYVLTQADIDAGKVDNTATAAGQWGVDGSGAAVKVSTTASADVPNLSKPALTILKEVDSAAGVQDPTAVGDPITYKFTVTNTGNTTLKSVVISDPLTGIAANPAGSFSLGDMPPDDGVTAGINIRTAKASYAVTQADIDAGKVTNTATASGVYGPGNTSIKTSPSSVDVPLHQMAALTLTKVHTGTVPNGSRAGTAITWTVTAKNTGNVTLNTLTVTDIYPGAVVTPTPLVSLAPGVSADFAVTAPLSQASINSGKVANTATITTKVPGGGTGPTKDASASFDLPPQAPAIALKKNGDVSGLGTPPNADDQIAYTIVVRNTGNVPLTALDLTDQLAGVVLDPTDMAALATATLQPQNTAGSIPTTQTDITVHGTYKLTTADIEAGKVTNTAHITGTSTFDGTTKVTDQGGTTFVTDDPTVISLTKAPAIALVKTIKSTSLSSPPKAGDTITYAFDITNTGNVTLTDITLTDPSIGAAVTSSGWTGPLAPSAHNDTDFTATYALTQADIDKGSFANQATASGLGKGTSTRVSDLSGSAIDNDTPTVQALTRTPGLTVVKSADATKLTSPPKPGDKIDYTVTVTNTGNVTLTKIKPTDTLFDPAGTGWSTIASLLPGAHQDFTATYVVKQSDIEAGKVHNQASASYTTPSGPGPDTPSNAVDVPLKRAPSIALVKTITTPNGLSDPPTAGQTIPYTFTITNTGNVALNDIKLEDVVGGVTLKGGPITSLAPGALDDTTFSASYVIKDSDIAKGGFVNQAKATGIGKDDNGNDKPVSDLSGTAIDNDTPTEQELARPSLTVEKSASYADNGDGFANVGDNIKYSFLVTNTGNVTLTGVTPVDPGPEFNGKVAAGELSAFDPLAADIAPGGQQVFTATYKLEQADVDNGAGKSDSVTNTATAKGTYNSLEYDAPPSNAKLSMPGEEPGKVSIVKQAGLSQIRVGETVPFTIIVSNKSTGNVGLVDITDEMPRNFVYVTGSARQGGMPVTPVVTGSTVTFDDVPLGPNATVKLTLTLRALSTAVPGHYENVAIGDDQTGHPLAPPGKAGVDVIGEGVLDCSDLIGKVFDDLNRNRYPDEGEPGLPGVRLATTRGVLVTTDAYGRYSIPCAALPNTDIGSNFVLKVDVRTLPTGYSLTTHNPAIVRLTAGKMAQLNFGAAIGHEVRLDITAKAFMADGITPTPAFKAGLDALIPLLQQHQSTVLLTYAGDAGEPAMRRLGAVAEQLRQRWKRAGASDPLEIIKRASNGRQQP